jgi:hypothetical protein
VSSRKARTAPELQGVEVGEEGAKLLVGEAVGDTGHHAASVDDGLGDETVVRGESAGQIFSLVHAVEAGAFRAARGIRVVAGGTALIVDLAAFGLLRVQAELRVGFNGFVGTASGEDDDEGSGGETGEQHRATKRLFEGKVASHTG